MSWLRIDDGAPEHRKVLGLPRADRWTWIELLAYCARQQEDGIVPAGIDDALRHVTPAFVRKCIAVGLLDVDDAGEMRVHNWAIYNGATLDERVSAVLDRYPQASANEVHRAIGGNRNAVLESVRRNREQNRERGTNAGSKGGISPSRPKTYSPRTSSVGPARDDDDDDLILRLDELRPSESQRLTWLLAASANRGKVERQLAAAVANGRNPAAYLDALIERDEDPAALPDVPPVERPPLDPLREAAARVELEALGPFRSREDDLREAIERTEADDDDRD